MNKRRIFIIAVSVLILVLISIGTVAFLTAKDSITNRFMVASYDSENPVSPDEIFSIRIYETIDSGQTESGQTYYDVKPGDIFKKDPTIQNTGLYGQWIRMIVSLTNANQWIISCESYGIEITEIFGGYDDKVWTLSDEVSYDSQSDTLTFVFYLNNVLEAENTATLFEYIIIPTQFTSEDIYAISNFNLIISADAIQSANTGSSAKEAFELYWK